MASEDPNSIPFANAAVFGLTLSTAADALFNLDFLNLHLPTQPAQEPTDKTQCRQQRHPARRRRRLRSHHGRVAKELRVRV